MALSEMQRDNLPLRQKMSLLALQGIKASQIRIKGLVQAHGLLPILLSLMVITSCIRLLWSTHFPLAWWIILGLLVVFEAVGDKIIWPKDRPVLLTEEKQKQDANDAGQL